MTATGLASRNFEQFWSAGRHKGAMVGFLDASGRPGLLAGSCEHREVRPRQLHNGVGGAVRTGLVRRRNGQYYDKVFVELSESRGRRRENRVPHRRR